MAKNYMKKIGRRIILLFVLILTTSALFAAVPVDQTQVINLRGRIYEEELYIQLLQKNTQDVVQSIHFPDLEPLNTVGYLVSDDVYSLVYSYIKQMNAVSEVVKLQVTSDGLSADGGNSYPIAISFVTEDSDSDSVRFPSKSISVTGTAEWEVFSEFRIRLDNTSFASIASGTYTGNIAFQLIAE